MNQLTKVNEKFTTIKELSELYKVSCETVRRAVKELFPDKIQNGIKTILSDVETAQVKDYILDNKRIDNCGKKIMTIKEVSDVLGVSRDLIENTINILYPEKMQQGKVTFLDEIETTNIKKEIEKNKLINFRQVSEVTTEVEEMALVAKAHEILTRKIRELQTKTIALERMVEEAKPKIESYDKVLDSKNAMTMNEVAKTLDMGRNKLFENLREQKILMDNNMPYQKYCDTGYFKVRQFSIIHNDNSIEVKTQTLVTGKGIDFILKLSKLFPKEA